jgi:hypothetical protein
VGPTLQRAAPGIAQGAASGAAVAGPYGLIFGAGLGAARALLKKPAQPPSVAPGVPAAPIAPPAPAIAAPAPLAAPAPPAEPAAPAVPAALPTGPSAAATILSLMENPIVKEVFLSQALGPTGGEQVRTPSGTNLPRGAINSLLSQLLANATEELPESESISEQSYLIGESGEFLVDPASPEQQAALVLSHLQSSRARAFRAPTFESDENFGDVVEISEWMSEGFSDTESVEWMESDESTETVGFY